MGLGTFTLGGDMLGGAVSISWAFLSESIQLGSVPLISIPFHKDSEISFSRFTLNTYNVPTGWTDNVTCYIITDTEETLIPYNESITMTPTNTAKIKFVASSTDLIDRYDDVGRQIRIEVKYN